MSLLSNIAAEHGCSPWCCFTKTGRFFNEVWCALTLEAWRISPTYPSGLLDVGVWTEFCSSLLSWIYYAFSLISNMCTWEYICKAACYITNCKPDRPTVNHHHQVNVFYSCSALVAYQASSYMLIHACTLIKIQRGCTMLLSVHVLHLLIICTSSC